MLHCRLLYFFALFISNQTKTMFAHSVANLLRFSNGPMQKNQLKANETISYFLNKFLFSHFYNL